MYKPKSYRGLVLYFACYFLLMILLPGICVRYTEHSMRILLNICLIGLALLMFVIERTQRVYWINGVQYEDAQNAGEERRKAFARAHLKRFGLLSLVFLIFSCLSSLLRWNPWIDFVLAMTGLIAVAISTVKIRL